MPPNVVVAFGSITCGIVRPFHAFAKRASECASQEALAHNDMAELEPLAHLLPACSNHS